MEQRAETGKLVVGEAARCKVPMSKRLGFGTNLSVMSGFVIVISSLLVGGIVGINFPPKLAVPIIFFAALSNSFVAILIGGIAARTGYSSALIYRYSYGRKGTLLPNIVMAFTGIGWFAVIVNITRDAFTNMVGIPVGSPVFWVTTLAISILFVIPAYKSIRWIGYVNWVAVPALILILLTVIVKTFQTAGGAGALFALEKSSGLGILAGFTMAAGGWLQGATVSADFARFFKNSKESAYGMLIAFGLLVFVQFCGGAFGAAVTGKWNIFLVMGDFGLMSFSFIALFLGAWSTGQAIVYGCSLQLAAPPVPMYKDQEATRRLIVVLLWAFAVLGAIFGIEKVVNWWLQFLAAVIVPIATTVILDYWAFPNRQKMYENGQAPDMSINPAAIVAWLVGYLVAYYTGKYQFMVSIINGMVATCIVYYPWMSAALKRGTTPEKMFSGNSQKKLGA
ncbi:MAG: cytosine permease [Firmicutes bacterium]|nr:cytosine permease [Bacillota bacterium]